jgi:hypothetical protein
MLEFTLTEPDKHLGVEGRGIRCRLQTGPAASYPHEQC